MTIAMSNLNTSILPANVLIAGLAAAGAASGTAVSLIGDVTGVGVGSIQTAIAAGAVSYAKMQNESALTLLGNPSVTSQSPGEGTIGAGFAFVGTQIIVDPVALRGFLFGLNTATNAGTPTIAID